MLGDRATGDAGEQLTDFIATQAAGSPLFAEELARLAAKGQDATSAPTIEAAIQVHLDALEDASRDAAIKLSVFGMVGWDAGLQALGVANAAEALRQLASSEILFEQATSRFKDTREWSFKHALMREVAYASLGEDALRSMHARVGHWLAKMGEDDATVARHLDLGGESVAAAGYLEKAARRALAANALGEAVSLAERALAFAEDKPTQFARAQLLDEAWNRLDARAGERDTAVRAMEEARRRPRERASARGAPASATRTRAAAVPRRAHASTRCAATRRPRGLADEEARCAAALAARYAFAGELDQAAEVADPSSPSRRSTASRAPQSTPGRRSPSCANRAARSAPRSTRDGQRRARRERGRAEDARGDPHDQRRLRAHDASAPRTRRASRSRAGSRSRRRSAPRAPCATGR